MVRCMSLIVDRTVAELYFGRAFCGLNQTVLLGGVAGVCNIYNLYINIYTFIYVIPIFIYIYYGQVHGLECGPKCG